MYAMDFKSEEMYVYVNAEKKCKNRFSINAYKK